MLAFETTYPVLRVYYNSSAAYPYIFSVDDGNFNTEHLAKNVVGQGVHKFVYNGQVPNPVHPVAWIQYQNARVHQIDESDDNLFIENDIE